MNVCGIVQIGFILMENFCILYIRQVPIPYPISILFLISILFKLVFSSIFITHLFHKFSFLYYIIFLLFFSNCSACSL